MPDDRDQEDILKRRKETGIEKNRDELGLILLEELTGECVERSWLIDLGSVELNIIKPTTWERITRSFSLRHQSKSPNRIMGIKIYLDEKELKTLTYKKQWWLTDVSEITIPDEVAAGRHDLKVVALDEKWFSDMQIVNITLADEDTTPPYLMKDKIQVAKKEWEEGYNIALLFADEGSTIAQGSIEQNGEVVYDFKWNVAYFDLSDLSYPITYTAIDAAGNKLGDTLNLQSYAE